MLRSVNADLLFDVVVLVLEGKARAGAPEGEAASVTTMHAPGSGETSSSPGAATAGKR